MFIYFYIDEIGNCCFLDRTEKKREGCWWGEGGKGTKE